MLGYELSKRQIRVLHIDNPLEHIGLEPSPVFLGKTRQAVANLLYLYTTGIIPRKFIRHIRLIRVAALLKKTLLYRPVKWWLRGRIAPLERRLVNHPKTALFWFDIYRLALLTNGLA